MWLAEVGKERIDEIIDFELAIDRAEEGDERRGFKAFGVVFKKGEPFLELKINLLTLENTEENILWEYFTFCRVFDEKKTGLSRDKILTL